MIAIVVVVVLPPVAIPVALVIMIPVVVVIVVATRGVPVPFVVAPTVPIWCYPVRLREWWARPIPVMPDPLPISGIPIRVDPLISRARLDWHAIRAWGRWRRAEGEAERHLCLRPRRGKQQQNQHG